MPVIDSKIQTVEDIYRLVWSAVANRRPIRAIYKERPRLLCPHRLGRNRAGQLRVLCYQYSGESESGLAAIGAPDNWCCVALEKLRQGEVLEGSGNSEPYGWREGGRHHSCGDRKQGDIWFVRQT